MNKLNAFLPFFSSALINCFIIQGNVVWGKEELKSGLLESEQQSKTACQYYENSDSHLKALIEIWSDFCSNNHDNAFCQSNDLTVWSQKITALIGDDMVGFLRLFNQSLEPDAIVDDFLNYLPIARENIVFLNSYHDQIQEMSGDIGYFSELLMTHVDKEDRLPMSHALALLTGHLNKSNQALWDLMMVYQKAIETYQAKQDQLNESSSRQIWWITTGVLSTLTVVILYMGGKYLFYRGVQKGTETATATLAGTAAAVAANVGQVYRRTRGSITDSIEGVTDAMRKAVKTVKNSPLLSPRGGAEVAKEIPLSPLNSPKGGRIQIKRLSTM